MEHGVERPDYYSVLGVPDTATDEEIARAYRRLARRLHPDANPNADGASFRDATAAYDVISDPARREAYDAARRGAPRTRGTTIPIRHARAPTSPPPRPSPPPPPPVELPEVTLSFEEAVLGTTATVHVDEPRACPACQGSGRTPVSPSPCADCRGTGMSVRQAGQIRIRQRCTRCGGQGQLPVPPCDGCGGEGSVISPRKLVVKIPAGVEDGGRVRVPWRGPTGDAGLYLTVRVAPHPVFTRRGRDVEVRLPVTIAEAALGASIRVPTVDGAGVTVRVPPGTQHGRTLRVAGHGVRHRDGPGALLVIVEVLVPQSLSDAQRRALEAFAAATEPPR